MKVKAIIVDDEYLARQRIIKLLEERDQVDVVGEAKNADQAVALIEEREPDLVFLDVQMPGGDGFSVLSRLNLKRNPEIIFTTAFDQYALDAFSVHALDYLLKPFDEDRFNQAVDAVIEQLQLKKSSRFNNQIMSLLRGFEQEETEQLSQFTIKEKGREIHVKVNDILFFETAGNYVILHTLEKQVLYRATMNTVEQEVDSAEFLRIHRSFLLNKRFIKSQQYVGGNEFSFTLKNGKTLQSAKSYKESIKQFLDLHF